MKRFATRRSQIAAWLLSAAAAAGAVHASEGMYTGVVGPVKSNAFGLEVKSRYLRQTVYLSFDPGTTRNAELIAPRERVTVVYDVETRRAIGVSRPVAGDEEEPVGRPKSPTTPDAGRADAARTWLVLIGVESYSHPELGRLGYTVDDVDAVRDLYLKGGGLDPTQVLRIADGAELEPTRETIDREVPAFLARAREGDTLVVMYSGHGVVAEADAKAGLPSRAYLAPSDCDPSSPASLEATGVPIDGLLATLAGCKATDKVLLLDACHSGAVNQEGAQINTLLKAARGVISISSCQAGQVSREDEALGHGVFTALLLDGLAGAADADFDGAVRTDELYNHLFAHSGESGQTPVQFRPSNVVGQPAVIRLRGPAATLADARRLSRDAQFDAALTLVSGLAGSDDPRLEFERLDLLDMLATKSTGTYFVKAEADYDVSRKHGEALKDEHTHGRMIRSSLALAASALGAGDRERFQRYMDDATARLGRIQTPLRYVEYSASVADLIDLLQARANADFEDLRDEYAGTSKEILDAAYAKVAALPLGDSLYDARGVVAGAAWRTKHDELWERCIAEIGARSADTTTSYLNLGLAHALARNPNGALKCAQETEKLRVADDEHQSRAALAYAYAARSAANERGRGRARAGEADGFEEAASRAVAILKTQGVEADSKGPAPEWSRKIVLTLIQAYARVGRFADAEAWIARLPEKDEMRCRALCDLAIGRARRGFIEEARATLDRVDLPYLAERLDACQAIAQAEAMVRSDRLNLLFEWIRTRPFSQDKIAAYSGLIDGLNKKPWTRLPGKSPDVTMIRYAADGNPEVQGAAPIYGDDVAPREAPAQPVLRPMANDYNAIQATNYLSGLGASSIPTSLGGLESMGASLVNQPIAEINSAINAPGAAINDAINQIPYAGGYVPSVPSFGIPSLPF